MQGLDNPVQTHSEIVQVHSLLQSSEETKQFAWFNWTFTGPSDTAQTCDLMVPNHPFYQLNYTRIYKFQPPLSSSDTSFW